MAWNKCVGVLQKESVDNQLHSVDVADDQGNDRDDLDGENLIKEMTMNFITGVGVLQRMAPDNQEQRHDMWARGSDHVSIVWAVIWR